MGGARKRKSFPLPLDPILNSEAMSTAPHLAQYAIFRLIIDWWDSECPDFPFDGEEARRLVQMPSHLWKIYEHRVDEILLELKLVLKPFNDRCLNKRHKAQINVAKGRKVYQATLAQEAKGKRFSDVKAIGAIPVSPSKNPRDFIPKHDPNITVEKPKNPQKRLVESVKPPGGWDVNDLL